jgi:20S proteasome alpha/beta subunit
MTIAVGLLANGGVVLAADTQLTHGSSGKGQTGKIMAQSLRGRERQHTGVCAVTGATNNFDFLHGLGDELCNDFIETINEADKETAFERFEGIVYSFFGRHILPEPELDVSVLVGYQRDGVAALWQSSRGLLVEQPEYGAVGIGSPEALGWLGRMWRGHLDIPATVITATFAVAAAKDSVEGCGKHTDILIIEADGFRRVHKSIVNEIDALYEVLSYELQPNFLHRCFGERSPSGQSSESDFTAQLHRLTTQIRDTAPEWVTQWRRDRYLRLVGEQDPKSPTPDSSDPPASQE